MNDAAKRVWREGLSPQLSTAGLLALRQALTTGDDDLLQGRTTRRNAYGYLVNGACPVAYCGWKGDGHRSWGELEDYFAERILRAEAVLNLPNSGRYLTNWIDDTPRAEMVPALLAEVDLALAGRGELPAEGRVA